MRNGRLMLRALLIVLTVCTSLVAEAGGRVPTDYNRRYQILFAQQEMFRLRPELLACVFAARDYIQNTQTTVFNKLNFTPKSVQTAYVAEGVEQGKNVRTIRMTGSGRVRAYSFLENWENADIECRFISGASPTVRLTVGADDAASNVLPSAPARAN